MINFNNILYLTDCSSLSKEAMKYATDIALTYNAKLTVFEVIKEISLYGNRNEYLSPDRFEKLTETHEKAEKKRLMEFWNSLDEQRIDPEFYQVQGNEMDQIIKHVEKSEFDLIIMGTHGRKGIQRIVQGSIAEKVVRHAKAPVLVVKGKKETKVSAKAS